MNKKKAQAISRMTDSEKMWIVRKEKPRVLSSK